MSCPSNISCLDISVKHLAVQLSSPLSNDVSSVFTISIPEQINAVVTIRICIPGYSLRISTRLPANLAFFRGFPRLLHANVGIIHSKQLCTSDSFQIRTYSPFIIIFPRVDETVPLTLSTLRAKYLVKKQRPLVP